MGAYLLIYHDKSPEEAARLVRHGPVFVTFRLAVQAAGMQCWLRLYSTSVPSGSFRNHICAYVLIIVDVVRTAAGMRLNSARRTISL